MSSHEVRLLWAVLAAVIGTAPAAAQDAGGQRVAVAAPPVAKVAPEPTASPEVPAASALSPEARAFKAALAAETAGLAGTERAAIDGFYAARDYAPFWGDAGSGRAAALIAALEGSGAEALPIERYDPSALEVLLAADADEVAPAKAEAAATRAFLGYAGDLAGGVLRPSTVDPEIDLRPDRPSAAALLARLGDEPVADILASLAPTDPDYRRLIAEKARLEGLLGTASWGPGVPTGPTLHPGERGPRIAELRARLARLGYGAPGEGPAGDAFDAELERAVQGFQRYHGLIDDGVVGARTLAAINAPVETRLAQVIVNLERLRWTDDEPTERHLVVNIPDYSVTLFEDGRRAWHTRAVVGEAAETRTPEFSDVITYLVVNPTWHIPDSIAKRVFLPQLRSNPSVLANSNMRLFTRAGTEINPKLVDFTQYTTGNFPFRIKQRPSDGNALGRVKFMFPNQFSIYLHDTPHRELFDRDARAFSNGCIRLEEPLELAYILLHGQEADPKAAFARWQGGAERQVNLEGPIPVSITYRTVEFDDAGAARYRADVYGRDAAVFKALEAAGVTLPAAQG